ncbi:hypothetical protein AALP_AA1G108200 [Arabis alpina]|uniref:Uncharacterized protein n=1 Tax=Arabis alpina TaxID=50452 RepID=A0A087HMG1_ARAAL|nr:hypothetical protein AALP_AA1G108200 [Arabis alpina]
MIETLLPKNTKKIRTKITVTGTHSPELLNTNRTRGGPSESILFA